MMVYAFTWGFGGALDKEHRERFEMNFLWKVFDTTHFQLKYDESFFDIIFNGGIFMTVSRMIQGAQLKCSKNELRYIFL